MKVILISAMLILLSGCAATEQPMPSNTIAPKPISEQDRLMLQVKQFPQDTVALTKLVELRLAAYEKQSNLYSLQLALESLALLLARQPHNYDVVLKYYRLNLLKGFALRKFDIDKWTKFYQQHDYLTAVNLAPPQYMAILLSDKGSLPIEQQKTMLLATIAANPSFINAYIELALIYLKQDNLKLALHLLNTANDKNPHNPDILTPLNNIRIEQAYTRMCYGEEQGVLKQAFNDYKALIKLSPDDADLHMQMSTVLTLMNRNAMSAFSMKKAAKLSPEYQALLVENYFWNNNRAAFEQYFVGKPIEQLAEEDLYLLLLTNLIDFNWQQAQVIADEYMTRTELSFYGVVYSSYVYRMQGQSQRAQQVLQQGITKLILEPWQQKMLDFSQGKITQAKLLVTAKNKCQQSEGLFIAALESLYTQQTSDARKHLQAIEALKIYGFYEYVAAKRLLKRLES